jgi:Fe2+ or Zn2+ uptake regulation protein
MTRQRKAILKALRQTDSHPTADQVYLTVRTHLPNVSLGTVYRNLEFLSQDGLIRKLEVGGSQRRYDGNINDHCHVRCLHCGRVADIWIEPISLTNTLVESHTDFEVMGHHLDFVGVCPDCQKKSLKRSKIPKSQNK